MTRVTLTKHGEKRIRERAGLSKKACERMAQIAFRKGAAIEDTKGRLRNYMLQHYANHDGMTSNMRVYGDKLWIFNGTCLITVLHIPTGISAKGTGRYLTNESHKTAAKQKRRGFYGKEYMEEQEILLLRAR